MYARSTTIQANLSSIDAGLTHVRDEVLPALQQLHGFIGLSMMLDRESGRCIATSAWQTEDDMHAGAVQVQPVRNRAAQILGGSPEVEEWEIAVMHREHTTHDDACVRSAWLQTDPARIADAVDIFKMVPFRRSRHWTGSAAPASWSTELQAAQFRRRASKARRPWRRAGRRRTRSGQRVPSRPTPPSWTFVSSNWQSHICASPRWPSDDERSLFTVRIRARSGEHVDLERLTGDQSDHRPELLGFLRVSKVRQWQGMQAEQHSLVDFPASFALL